MTDVITPKEIAERTGLSLNAVYQKLEKGEIPGRKVGSRWLTRRVTFDRWLDGKPEPSAKSRQFLHRIQFKRGNLR